MNKHLFFIVSRHTLAHPLADKQYKYDFNVIQRTLEIAWFDL